MQSTVVPWLCKVTPALVPWGTSWSAVGVSLKVPLRPLGSLWIPEPCFTHRARQGCLRLRAHISLWMTILVARQVAKFKKKESCTSLRMIVKAHVHSDAESLLDYFIWHFLGFLTISIHALVYAIGIYPGLNCQNQFSRKTSIISLASRRNTL